MKKQTTTLSKSALSVQNALSSQGESFTVIELSSSTRTASDAAKTIGCDVAQIVKSLVFRLEDTLTPIIILASGLNRVNEKAIGNILGAKIQKADADFVRDVTGFAIGGIPPIGHKQEIQTFIDEELLKFSELWAAAGTPHAVFKLDSSKLEILTNGKINSIK